MDERLRFVARLLEGEKMAPPLPGVRYFAQDRLQALKGGTEMKCLRVYSTADGESHFDEVEIPTISRQVHPTAAAFDVSMKYGASGIRFTRIPANAGRVDWHNVPERALTVRLEGSAEYQTSDGDQRHVPAGSFVMFEDIDGRGHRTLHSAGEQTVLWIFLPQGLEIPRR
jgi:hypothetical protein